MRAFARSLGLLALSFSLVLLTSDLTLAAAPVAQAAAPVRVSRQAFQATDFLSLTNAARSEQGLAPLVLSDQLSAAALAKAENMAAEGYFEHFHNGVTPWSYIDAAGYHYSVAGENLAKGFRTPEGITKAWLNSPTHRANLMSAKYQDVGYACIQANLGGEKVLLTVQMFGSR